MRVVTRHDIIRATVVDRILETTQGRGRIWSPRAGVFASVLEGQMNVDFAEAYIEVGDAVLEHCKQAVGIHDWSDMTGYDSGVRSKVTAWAMRVITRFEAIHVFSQSSVVRMGVSVANIALGGRIVVHAQRDAFEQARDHLMQPRS